MPYDRKNPPAEILLASMHQQGRDIWNKSKGRRFDTFVGVTHIATGQSFIYPVFIKPEKSSDYGFTRVSSGLTSSRARVALSGVQSTYKDEAIVVDGSNPAMVGDGFAHMQAVEKAARAAGLGDTGPEQFIGWALMGNNNPNTSFMIRFSSGLNNRYQTFNPRRPRAGESTADFERRIEASNKESRDLPKEWRNYIMEMLKSDLNLVVEQHTRVELKNNQDQLKNTAVALARVAS